MTMLEQLTPLDCWRAVVLLGRNTATYKIALAQSLSQFVFQGHTQIPMNQLAETFFDLYLNRLAAGRPQLSYPGRQTVMERIVALYNLGKLDRGAAIERVALEAFSDVIPRFHTVGDLAVPVPFYEYSDAGLVVTDAAFQVFNDTADNLLAELDSRWSLLEAAFTLKRQDCRMENDIRSIYLETGYDRTNITHNVPFLNGYQNGMCFYCGEPLAGYEVHVDHCIPRQVIQHDELWNLVLAHGFCNLQKEDHLPGKRYLEKLIARNEHIVASNHPARQKIIDKLGTTSVLRAVNTNKVYSHAELVLRVTWEGIKGYDPERDPTFKKFLRFHKR
jgi:HNH endonuclease